MTDIESETGEEFILSEDETLDTDDTQTTILQETVKNPEYTTWTHVALNSCEITRIKLEYN